MIDHPPLAVENLRAQNAEVMRRADELLDAARRLPASVDDEDTAGKLADFVRQLSTLAKVADAARVENKAPYIEGGRILESFFASIIDPVIAAQKAAEEILTAYQVERNLDGPIRGEYGAVASLRRAWNYSDIDRAMLDLEKLRIHFTDDAFERALRSYIRAGGRELRGVKIFEKVSSVVR